MTLKNTAFKNTNTEQPVQEPTDIAALVEGMEVSIDVSTGEHDSDSRLFGTVTLAQENQGSKHGLILLIQDAEPNFQPAPPVQGPVACRFCHSEKGCWAWQCYHCGEIDDVQKPAPAAQRKPLTLNAMTAIEEKVYMKTTHKGKPSFEYAQSLIRATEAAHGIKEGT